MKRNIRVLLVDDEFLAIEDLKTIIDWESLHFKIVATARSGKQALNILKNTDVDLVITDIMMPGMNGITLVEKVKEFNKEIIFLLLTAYAEVDYMKNAFHLGVEDYLIKDEITPTSLAQKLQYIQNKYERNRELSYSYLQKKLHNYFSKPMAVENDLPSDLMKESFYYCLLANDNFFLPLLQNTYNTPRLTEAEDNQQEEVLRLLEHYELESVEHVCCFSAFNNKLLILFRIRQNEHSLQKKHDLLYSWSHSITSMISQTLNYHYSCFYSTFALSLREIYDNSSQIQQIMRARYFFKQSSAYPFDSPSLFVTNTSIDISEEIFSEWINNNSFQKNYLDFWELVEINHNYMGLFQLLTESISFLMKNNILLYENVQAYDCFDLSSIKNFLLEQFAIFQNSQEMPYSRDILKAFDFIKNNFALENLSAQDVAEHIGFSVNHFSRLFKKETGDTFINYLTSFRIQKACDFLRKSEKKMYEVAESVGYSSPQYFSQVFYKYTGLTPMEYKKKGNAKYDDGKRKHQK